MTLKNVEPEWLEVECDERWWVALYAEHTGLDVLTMSQVYDWTVAHLATLGHQGRTVTRRLNERGEQIGSDVRVSQLVNLGASDVAAAIVEARDTTLADAVARWATPVLGETELP